MTNILVLSGKVCRNLLHKVSPSRTFHCQFFLEHRSIQREAGFHRKVWCIIPVISSGKKNQIITDKIKIGSDLIVLGFISYHNAGNGLKKWFFMPKK